MTLATVDDADYEEDSTVTVAVSPGDDSYTVGEPGTATVTVEDDDGLRAPPAHAGESYEEALTKAAARMVLACRR